MRWVLWNLGGPTSWNPQVLSRRVTGVALPLPFKRGVKIRLRPFLTSGVTEGELLTSRTWRFTFKKEPQSPPNRRLNRAQSQSGGFVEDKNVLHFHRIRTPDRPTRSAVPIPTELCRAPKLPRSSTSHKVHRGADKSLARPGRKQHTATEDFELHISYL